MIRNMFTYFLEFILLVIHIYNNFFSSHIHNITFITFYYKPFIFFLPLIVLPAGGNPFATVPVCNPFQAAKPPPPTINQLRSQNIFPMGNDSISSLTGPLGPSTITPVMPVTMPNNHPLSSQPMVPLSSPSSSHNPFAM